jgi:hypothetical protein
VFTLTGDVGTNENILSVGQIQGNPIFAVNANGTYYINTVTILANVATSPVTVLDLNITTNDISAAYFDYQLNDGGSNFRSGTIMTAWNSSTLSYSETSTPDLLGTDTSMVSFGLTHNTTYITLTVSVASGASDWIIKIGARTI